MRIAMQNKGSFFKLLSLLMLLIARMKPIIWQTRLKDNLH